MASRVRGSAAGSGRESQVRKDQRRQDAEQRRRSQPLRSRLQALDARLAGADRPAHRTGAGPERPGSL